MVGNELVSSDNWKKIEELIGERADAKKRKDFELADELLLELDVEHNVRVDDAQKKWHFKGKKKERLDSVNADKKRDFMKQFVPDWSESDDDKDEDGTATLQSSSIPEGITIDEERSEIPEGISIIDEDESEIAGIPEGITIVDDDTPSIPIPEGITIEEDEDDIDESAESEEAALEENNGERKSELESLTVVVIKEKLREAGLPVSGRKADLIERLLSNS